MPGRLHTAYERQHRERTNIASMQDPEATGRWGLHLLFRAAQAGVLRCSAHGRRDKVSRGSTTFRLPPAPWPPLQCGHMDETDCERAPLPLGCVGAPYEVWCSTQGGLESQIATRLGAGVWRGTWVISRCSAAAGCQHLKCVPVIRG